MNRDVVGIVTVLATAAVAAGGDGHDVEKYLPPPWSPPVVAGGDIITVSATAAAAGGGGGGGGGNGGGGRCARIDVKPQPAAAAAYEFAAEPDGKRSANIGSRRGRRCLRWSKLSSSSSGEEIDTDDGIEFEGDDVDTAVAAGAAAVRGAAADSTVARPRPKLAWLRGVVQSKQLRRLSTKLAGERKTYT